MSLFIYMIKRPMITWLLYQFIFCIWAPAFNPEPCVDILNEVVEEEPVRLIRHKWYADDSYVQDFVNFAYRIGGLDFVKLIECENWRRDSTRVSKTNDHWLCQVNPKWHTLPGDWDDPYIQLMYCYDLWTWGIKFYGPGRWIHWQRCSDYVSSRFELL